MTSSNVSNGSRRGSGAGWHARAGALLHWVDAHPTASVFAVGLALRLAAVVLLPDVINDTGGDAGYYLSIARDLVHGRGYGVTLGDTTRVPLYQVFLAAHLWLFGDTRTPIAVSQAVLGAATAVLMTWTAEALVPGRRRWIVGMLWATYPPAILNVVVIFTQTLQVFFLTGAFLALVLAIRRRSLLGCGAAAMLFGTSCLTRAGNLFFLPVFSAGPIFCWRLREPETTRWAVRAALVMLLCGTASVVWWTARRFPRSLQIEDLLLDPREHDAVRFLLRPLQPLPDRMSAGLRDWRDRWEDAADQAQAPAAVQVPIDAAASASAADTPSPLPGSLPAASLSAPAPAAEPSTLAGATASNAYQAKSSEQMDAALEIGPRWTWEVRRIPLKLWQTFGAPDGCLQLGCTGPPGGFWAAFRSTVRAHPVQAAALALAQPCLVLKSVMYVQHYLLLLLTIPGCLLLWRYAPGVTLLLLCYGAYTIVIVALGANYSMFVYGVPRYGFSLTPVPVLLVGLLLVAGRWPGGRSLQTVTHAPTA